jgi:type IV pilus assembly protein PilN
MIRINLLPVKAAQKKEKLRGQLVILLACVVIAAAGCTAVYLSLQNKVAEAKEENLRREEEINQLKKKIGEVGRFKKMKEELQGKLDILDKLKEGQSGPVHLLDELSGRMPDKLWVNSFKSTAGTISISGLGLNEETVAQFLRDLEASPYYRNVELQVIEQVTQGGLKLHKFDISARVETPPKSPAK